MERIRTPSTNRLLDQLTVRDCARVLAASEKVDLLSPETLDEPGASIRNIYFPTGSSIALLLVLPDKSSLQVGLAGQEGVYGLPAAFGVGISPVHALVQGSGAAWRMGVADFRQELVRNTSLRDCISRYSYVVMSQLTQAAACNRFHVVERRLARWLLMTGDRAHSPSFRITHELLAYMLGVRRVSVTEAAGALHKRGLIKYIRGHVTILDRVRLEVASCRCYRSDLESYDRVFGRARLPFTPAKACDHVRNSTLAKEENMNWDRIEGNWKQFRGNVKEQWGKLTDDQLDVIAGKRDHLAGKIQEAYGITVDETEKQLAAWQDRQK